MVKVTLVYKLLSLFRYYLCTYICWLLNHLSLDKMQIKFGFPVGTVVKTLSANAGDTRDADSIPGSGRSPRGGNGNPLQYSEKFHGQGNLVGYICGVTKRYNWAQIHSYIQASISFYILSLYVHLLTQTSFHWTRCKQITYNLKELFCVKRILFHTYSIKILYIYWQCFQFTRSLSERNLWRQIFLVDSSI